MLPSFHVCPVHTLMFKELFISNIVASLGGGFVVKMCKELFFYQKIIENTCTVAKDIIKALHVKLVSKWSLFSALCQ